ncbi:hypothetical protein H5A40_00885 [Pectobacterium brasiliense]|uniref:hypothetical protein n=1 Tax=Pectobacterium brasiliense TaxID=180957 RepID=UPI001969415E|nr:hypothetical protein [Pectobacterium brasiliense]QSD35763.1 hypothetical protein H5A40_00885 [Pectobacterium brasiliense]
MTPKTIHINNLLLDLDNPRFPRIVESQREALNLMIELQSDKIELLASDIAKFGLDPSERLIIYKNELSEDTKAYTVAEGNRRLTALKLLQEPDLSENERTKSRIKKIIQTSIQLPKEIDCVIFDSPEEFEHWINLKHSGQNNGVGRVRWDTVEQGRYQSKHGNSSFGSQFWQFLENEKSLPDSISKNKNILKLTNITRMLDDPYVRDVLGLEVVNANLFCNQNKPRFIDEISKLIRAMQEVDEKGRAIFTVNKIRHKSHRQDVLNELNITKPDTKLDNFWELSNPSSYKEEPEIKNNNQNYRNGDESQSDHQKDDKKDNEDKKGKENENNSNEGKTQDNKKGSSSNIKHNPNRNTLIPSNVKYNFDNRKCKKIYDELKGKLGHDECPMSISVLFRVFIELSLICYLDKNNINLKKQQQGLHDKVVAVSNDLRDKGFLTNSQVSSVQSVSSSITVSQGSLQQYMHNKDTLPDRSSLNTQFDNLHCLFSAIWK